MLRHFIHHLHCSNLVLCDRYLYHMMLLDIPSHHFHHVPDLGWDVLWCQKNSRDSFSHFSLYKIRRNFYRVPLLTRSLWDNLQFCHCPRFCKSLLLNLHRNSIGTRSDCSTAAAKFAISGLPFSLPESIFLLPYPPGSWGFESIRCGNTLRGR